MIYHFEYISFRIYLESSSSINYILVVAGGYLMIDGCSSEFIVYTVSILQTVYNWSHREKKKELNPGLENGKEDITGATQNFSYSL